MRPNAGDELVPMPSRGRVYRSTRQVYVGDCGPDATMRLDGLARVLQDIGADDTEDAANPGGAGWVVRRTVLEVRRAPVLREQIEVATFCGGIGRRWGERRTSITGDAGAAVESAALWVHVDVTNGRPTPLAPRFGEVYGEAAGGREVTARQRHGLEVPDGAPHAPWQVRATDLDLLDHVNNAVGLAVLEQVRALAGDGPPDPSGRRVEVEYRSPLGRDDRVALLWTGPSDGVAAPRLRCWLVAASAADRLADEGGGTLAADEVFVTGTITTLDD